MQRCEQKIAELVKEDSTFRDVLQKEAPASAPTLQPTQMAKGVCDAKEPKAMMDMFQEIVKTLHIMKDQMQHMGAQEMATQHLEGLVAVCTSNGAATRPASTTGIGEEGGEPKKAKMEGKMARLASR